LHMPGLGISAGSFPVAVGWVTTVCQIVCLLSFSAFGDFGHYRKSLLQILTWLGSLFVFLNAFCVTDQLYWFAGLLRIGAGICFVMCQAYYNSYLPALMAHHPRNGKTEAELTDNASNMGNVAGYAGGVLLLLISLLVHMFLECDPCSTKCTEREILFWPALMTGTVGVWWAVFSIYSFMTLKSRPGPDFPSDRNALCLGWTEAFATLATVREYKQTFLFMMSYFIFSDAISTVVGSAFLLLEEIKSQGEGGQQVVLMSTLHIAWILAALGALLGVFLYQCLQRCTGMSGKQMLMLQFVVYSFVAVLCLGGGLKTLPFELVMAPCALTIGSLQSYARSIYSSLIPPGKESAMFAFYEITDKGSNLVGAAVIVLVHTTFHSYLPVFWYILLEFAVAFIILYFVDVEQGMAELGKGGEAAE